MYYLCIRMETKEVKVTKPKKENVVYFTDEMAKEIYVFPDKMSTKVGNPIMKSITFKQAKRK